MRLGMQAAEVSTLGKTIAVQVVTFLICLCLLPNLSSYFHLSLSKNFTRLLEEAASFGNSLAAFTNVNRSNMILDTLLSTSDNLTCMYAYNI